MTTMSTNIAGVMKPFKGTIGRQWVGAVYDLDDFFKANKKKKGKKKKSVYELLSVGDSILIDEKKEEKHTVNGKSGVWRTIRGRHYFFPDDGSGVIPPFMSGNREGE